MARNRANIEPGQTAYVGNLRFGPGQLLPEGTVEYQVKGFYALDPDEGGPRGVKGIPYSITVPVGTSRNDVQEAVALLASLTIADAYANYYETDENLGMDIFDVLNEGE